MTLYSHPPCTFGQPILERGIPAVLDPVQRAKLSSSPGNQRSPRTFLTQPANGFLGVCRDMGLCTGTHGYAYTLARQQEDVSRFVSLGYTTRRRRGGRAARAGGVYPDEMLPFFYQAGVLLGSCVFFMHVQVCIVSLLIAHVFRLWYRYVCMRLVLITGMAVRWRLGSFPRFRSARGTLPNAAVKG